MKRNRCLKCRSRIKEGKFCRTHTPLNNNDLCLICCEELKDDLVILKCNHLFHKKCLKNWFISSKIYKCMICDDELVDEKLNTIYPLSEDEEEDEPEYKIYSKFPDLWKLMK